jgi:hypothetical protein
MYFTMGDYIEFMLNWMRRKKKDQLLLNKLDIYTFLSNPTAYSNKYEFYKKHLSENADTIVYETYSILINHSLPV